VALQFLIEHYETQRQIMASHVFALQRDLNHIQNSPTFVLSQNSRDEYEELTLVHWKDLVDACVLHIAPSKEELKS